MRSTPRVVHTSITIGEPVGAENLTSACEMVGMMAIVIMAMSAAQTPTCSTTRDNPWGRFIDCLDGWPVRSVRSVIIRRYRGGLKKASG
jgi:peroxiredoxin